MRAVQSSAPGLVSATLLFLAFSLPLAGCDSRPSADLVLENGRIYTVNPQTQWAEALAVRDGAIVAVGDGVAVSGLIGEKTDVIDLEGRLVLPGIIDQHAHPFYAGEEPLFQCRVAFDAAFNELLSAVAQCRRETAEDGWIVGSAWGSHLIDMLSTGEALKQLDAVSRGRPVIFRDDTAHNAWVNSRVLELAGIDASTEDPERGVIVKDPATGAPTGLLLETAAKLAQRAIPPRSAEDDAAAAAYGAKTLNSFGVTSFLDAAVPPRIAAAYARLDKEGRLTARVGLASSDGLLTVHADRSLSDIVAARAAFASENVRTDYVKLFLDGVPTSWTSAFLEPYLPTAAHGAGFHGETHFTVERLNELVTAFDAEGLSIKIHAAGDASLRMALDAFEAARNANGDGGRVHQIAHAGYIHADDLPRFAKLRVVADASPILWFPTPILTVIENTLGAQRANRWWPFRELTDSGAIVAAGSDWPAATPIPDPWTGLEALVSRRHPEGRLPGALWPEQALTLEEAVRVYTINGAIAMNIDAETGSLEVGKSADFIILSQNIFEVPVEDISETTVVSTFFRGDPVFTDGSFTPPRAAADR